MAPRSWVWDYFKKVPSGTLTKCPKCPTELKYCGTPSTLAAHLKKAHNILPPGPPSKKRRETERENEADEEIIDEPTDKVQAQQPAALAPRTPIGPPESTTVSKPPAAATPSSSSSRPGKINEMFENYTAFKVGGSRYNQATDALAYMVCVDNLPLRTPDKKGLLVYSKVLQPLFNPPSEPTLTKRIETKYESLTSLIGSKISQAESVCLTSDIWTEKHTMKSYLGITAHYLQGTDIESVEIGAKPMPERKNIPNIRAAFNEVCRDWGLQDYQKVSAMVTDGGANIKGAAKEEFGATKQLSCFAHGLNGIGQEVIRPSSKRPVPSEAENTPRMDEEAMELQSDSEDEDTGRRIDVSLFEELIRRVKAIVRFFRKSEVANEELLKLQADAIAAEEASKAAMLKSQAEAATRQAQAGDAAAAASQARAGDHTRAPRDWDDRDIELTIPLRLVQETQTRWNSCFFMLARFLLLSEFVSRVLFKLQTERNATRSKPPAMLSPYDLNSLKEAKDLLQPLANLTEEVSKEKDVTLSKCIPLIKGLKAEINKYQPETPIGFNLKEKLLQEIKTRFGAIEFVPIYQAATILDPRFKKFGFAKATAYAGAVKHVGQLIAVEIGETRAAEQAARAALIAAHPLESPKPGDVWADHDQAVRQSLVTEEGGADDDVTAGLPTEFKLYLRRLPYDRRVHPNPLDIWETLKADFPHIYKVARKYLSIVATSVPCERLFSHAGIIASARRSRLTPSHLNKLVFLRSIDDETMWGLPKIRKT